jgi:hypothetical protein
MIYLARERRCRRVLQRRGAVDHVVIGGDAAI